MQEIFDPIRKKYVPLTPEEKVRQTVIQYLIEEKKYPAGKISVEAAFEWNKIKCRIDVMVYDSTFKPFMLIECKAPGVKIDQKVLDQAVKYNFYWNCPYILLTNGQDWICASVSKNKIQFLNNLPEYDSLSI